MELHDIEGYARAVWRKLKGQGFCLPLDEIHSKASMIFVLADASRRQGEEFDNYFFKSMSNAIKNFKREACWAARHVVSIEDIPEEAFCYQDIVESEEKAEVLSKFSGLERLIVNEVIDPCEEVTDRLRAIVNRDREGMSDGTRQRSGDIDADDIALAISAAYGLPLNTVRWEISKIKKKLLTKES